MILLPTYYDNNIPVHERLNTKSYRQSYSVSKPNPLISMHTNSELNFTLRADP